MLACAAAPSPPPSPAAVVSLPSVPAATGREEPVAAVPDGPAAPREPTVVRPPRGYVEMTVVGVAPTEQGDAVLLADGANRVIVPIYVGGTESLAIQLRLRKERYARPLTHDLMDAMMRELDGSLVKVQVDSLQGSTFVGAVFVRKADREIEIDARPSDAIALALGNHVPIFVAEQVIEEAGVRTDKDAPVALPTAVPHI
jgi:uncharacterized protein